MISKEKYTGTQFINMLHSFGSIVIALFLFFTAPFSSNASEQATREVYNNGNAKIVYSVSGEETITITEGKITTAKGHAIRLLPGTHIKNGEQLAINIADKEYQEAVAKEKAREQEETMLATITEQQENKLLPRLDGYKKENVCNNGEIPAENSSVGQQSTMLAAVVVTISTNLKTPAQTIEKRISIQAIHNLRALAGNAIYTPTSSWGEPAETVKVMRC